MADIQINGLKELIKSIEKYPQLSEKHVNVAINRSLIRIQDQAKQNAPSGETQQLRQNWILKMGRFEGSLTSGANSRGGFQYGVAVEEGTKPHFIPITNNPTFQLWALRRGLNPYAVSRSVAKKGTKANPFFKKSIDQQSANVNIEFDKAISAIIEDI